MDVDLEDDEDLDILWWYYGPTEHSSDPGRMWHSGCPQQPPGEVLVFKDGEYLCECGATTNPERYEDD